MFDLAPSDLDAPPVHMDVFLVLPTGPTDSARQSEMSQALTKALESTLGSIPILAGCFSHTPKLHVQVTTGSKVRLDVVNLEDDPAVPSYTELEATGFDATLLKAPSLLPYPPMSFTDLAVNKVKEGAPVLYSQMSFIRGATILLLSGHHHVVDNRTFNFICLTLSKYT